MPAITNRLAVGQIIEGATGAGIVAADASGVIQDPGTYTVPTAEIADGAVTTAKLADDAVTQAKIGAGAVGATELASDAVTTAKVLDDAITTAKIADDAVTQAKIGAGAVGATELASDAVTTAKIADDAVETAKLADAAVTTAKVPDSAITLAKLADIANGTVLLNNTGGAAAPIAGTFADLITAAALATDAELASEASARLAADNLRLLLSGGTMTGQLISAVGSAASPGVRIGTDAGNGLYQRGSNDTGVARAGVDDGSLRGFQLGSFVPTIVTAVPGDISIAYGIQSAAFVRIGNLVSVRGLVRFTPTFTSASGGVTIAGLPFTNTSLVHLGLAWLSGTSWTSHVTAYVNASSTSIVLLKNNNAALTVADLLATGAQRDFYFSMVYHAV
jgi:hypothetical protein